MTAMLMAAIDAVDASLDWYEVLGRLALAGVLGALVGIEREHSGQDAGFRTHLMLALGAAVFGVVSVGAFDAFITDSATNVQIDVTRIASYVAAGVGFIGGGVILKHAGSVRGITTATSLWVAAAIGLAAGVGFWVAAVSATAIGLVALALLKPLSEWVDRRSHAQRSLVVSARSVTVAIAVVRDVHELTASSIRAIQLGEGPDAEWTEVDIQFWTRPDDTIVRRILERLQDEFGDDVRSVSMRR